MRIKSFLSFILVSLHVFAVDIDVKPGTLVSLLEGKTDVTELSVIGEIDAVDMQFMSHELRSLSSLDLSKARVVAYDSGERLLSGVAYSPAGELPAGIFAGATFSVFKFPSGIISVGDGAFAGSRVVSVDIPATVVSFGRHVFSGCERLEDVTVNIDSVPDGTFKGCVSLSSVNLWAGTSSIGESAFAGCVSLESIDIPAKVRSIGTEAFAMSGLGRVALDKCMGLNAIGERAFAGCVNLQEVTLPESLSCLGVGVFFGDSRLAGMDMPEKVTVIPDYAFKGTASPVNGRLKLHDRVTEVGRFAYMGLDAATEWEVPVSLEKIGENAFEGWKALERIDASGTLRVPATGDNVWEGVPDPSAVTLNVSDGSYEAYKVAPQWREFNVVSPGHSSVKPSVADTGESFDAWMEDGTLCLSSRLEMKNAAVYDNMGHLVTWFDINGLSGRAQARPYRTVGVMIVAVTMADGTTVVKKLMYGKK